jgi:hypothetical protein
MVLYIWIFNKKNKTNKNKNKHQKEIDLTVSSDFNDFSVEKNVESGAHKHRSDR